MDWLVLGTASLLFGSRLLLWWIPPHYRYLSSQKRRAMYVAVRAFDEEHPESPLDRAGSWVYRADAEKCFVFVKHASRLHPPSHSGYVVWHDGKELEHLGGWQFHWGILPRHAVEQYEACRAAGIPWPHRVDDSFRRRADTSDASHG